MNPEGYPNRLAKSSPAKPSVSPVSIEGDALKV